MERELFSEFYFGNTRDEAIKTSKKFQPNDPQFGDFIFNATKQDTIKAGGTQREENSLLQSSIDAPFIDANLESDTRESFTSMELMGFQGKEDALFEKVKSNRNKRKGKVVPEMDCQSKRGEDEENGSDASKSNQHATSSRRSRSAEMHNLSERRRRDRINEKLKALQELLPHCNKTDKASMLDEAIEYLKSLQIQLQMMWIGRGMAPMIYPESQHYMSIMAMDHDHHHHHVTSITRPLFDDQSKLRDLNANQPVNFINQTEGFYLHEISPQGTNQRGFGARTVQEPNFGDGLVIDSSSL